MALPVSVTPPMKSPNTAATFSMVAPASGVCTKEPMEVPWKEVSHSSRPCSHATHGRQAHQGVEGSDGLRQRDWAHLQRYQTCGWR